MRQSIDKNQEVAPGRFFSENACLSFLYRYYNSRRAEKCNKINGEKLPQHTMQTFTKCLDVYIVLIKPLKLASRFKK